MLTFQLPLENRPRIRLMGYAAHGRYPVERYRLNGLWCLHLYRYRARLAINGQILEIHPGDLGILPPDAELTYWFKGPSEHLFSHFELPDAGTRWKAPAMQPTGAEFSHLHRLFEEAAGLFPTQPLRAEVRLWDLLWTAAGTARSSTPGRETVAEVIRQIELRLHEPLLVESLAREAGVSHNHLTRLFRRETGKTVKAHMVERRMEKALHLLRVSSLPIKAIARDVGFEDLHAFNKAVNRYFGRPPRALRFGAEAPRRRSRGQARGRPLT